MRSSRSSARLSVIFDDERLVGHAGLLLASTLGERLGLGALFAEHLSLEQHGAHVADNALSVVHGLLAGADHIDDLDVLRAGGTTAVLGHRAVAPSTLGSFLRAITVGHVRQLDQVSGALLTRAWGTGRGGSPVVVDIDSTVCETYGLMKEGARKVLRTGHRGYHPILVATEDGEVVHARLRRGRTNDGSGAARFVGEALAPLRRAGARGVVLRADSGFYQRDVVEACRRRGAGFSIGARMQKGMAQAISAIPEEAWVPIDYPYGEGAAVAELAWQAFADNRHGRQTGGIEVRLVVRRVPPSPGIQAPLFPTFSYHPFITDQAGDLATVDQFHRRHARVENVIKDLKGAAGLEHLPSGRFGANAAWLVFATIAHNLACWVGRFGMGEGHRMMKTLRRRVLAVPGRITRSGRRRTLHLPAHWPWASELLCALERLGALPLVTWTARRSSPAPGGQARSPPERWSPHVRTPDNGRSATGRLDRPLSTRASAGSVDLGSGEGAVVTGRRSGVAARRRSPSAAHVTRRRGRRRSSVAPSGRGGHLVGAGAREQLDLGTPHRRDRLAERMAERLAKDDALPVALERIGQARRQPGHGGGRASDWPPAGGTPWGGGDIASLRAFAPLIPQTGW